MIGLELESSIAQPPQTGRWEALPASLVLWWLAYSTFVSAMAMTGSLVAVLYGFTVGALCTIVVLRRQSGLAGSFVTSSACTTMAP
jgi:hypothetical protein